MSKLKTFRLILFSYREAQHPPARALLAMAVMRAMAQSDTGVVAELEAVNGTCSHHQGLQFILDSSAPCQIVKKEKVMKLALLLLLCARRKLFIRFFET